FLFIREYDEEEDRREYSFIWPLSNFYSSPKSGGGRIIPIYWHRWELEGATKTSQTLTPVFYRKTTETAGTKETPASATSMTLTWLSYYQEDESSTTLSKLFFAPILPIFMYSNDLYKPQDGRKGEESFWYLFPFVY